MINSNTQKIIEKLIVQDTIDYIKKEMLPSDFSEIEIDSEGSDYDIILMKKGYHIEYPEDEKKTQKIEDEIKKAADIKLLQKINAFQEGYKALLENFKA